MAERVGVRLEDVARAAGVSVATASRALNGSARRVRPEHAERVAAAARELRYFPNAQAQAMARGTTTVVSLVVGDITDPYFAEIASGAMRAADQAGLVLVITSTSGDPEREATVLQSTVGLRPRAVVLAVSRRTTSSAEPGIRALHEGGASIVALVSDDPDGHAIGAASPLVIGNRAGAAALADALVGQGHRDFLVLAGEPDVVTARARTAGFVEGLTRRGRTPSDDSIIAGPFTRDGGYDAMTRLLASGRRPGCVFAVNDVTAVGALAAIRDHGLEPGQDIAVAGFDDVRMLADVTPSLSTVHLPLDTIGEAAVQTALGEDAVSTFAGTVVLRASTRPRQ
ncbi:LacI family DNA-binding transcriptional regulator [Curtobacterium sp. 22159]|uniref:LacI family DNA-binding transcriptional regulator n=1 Tax=Curtobacterium sp. 22159 TaxID=3453882 RepID=UPI003F8343DD